MLCVQRERERAEADSKKSTTVKTSLPVGQTLLKKRNCDFDFDSIVFAHSLLQIASPSRVGTELSRHFFHRALLDWDPEEELVHEQEESVEKRSSTKSNRLLLFLSNYFSLN